MGIGTWEDPVTKATIKSQRNWLDLLSSLSVLKDQGLALFMIEPHGLSTTSGKKFEKELNSRGFFVTGIFNTPEKIFHPQTSIQPVLITISRRFSQKLYLAELLEAEQAEQVAHNFTSLIDTHNLIGGKLIDPEGFSGFHRLKIQEQIERLETQYNEYRKFSLRDISVEINTVRTGKEFSEKENSVYVPNIGKSKVVSHLKDAKLKHHNYFQVVLKQDVINEYVASFFESEIGKLVLDSLSSQTFIPHVNKGDIESAIVAAPNIEEQRSIVLTQHKIRDLQGAIGNFEKEMAINPTSSKSIQSQINMMLEVIGALTDADRIRGLVREGESKNIEFKESFSLDVKKQTKEKYIEQAALKTVVAFLNSDGGTLLIGVSDKGEILGIDAEMNMFFKNSDQFLLNFKNAMKSRITEAFYPFIDDRLVEIDNRLILLVQCKASKTACFLDDKDFYVRTNPATDKLEGPKLALYLKHRFGE